MAELRRETEANSNYIRKCGYNLEELWECEWKQMKENMPELRRFISVQFRRSIDKIKTMTEREILDAVKDNTLFGMVECDIKVPEERRDYFAEMTPIFKNTQVSKSDIGDHMKAYAEDHNLLNQPRKTLIGSYQATNILLATPLLQWYLSHGLKVTKIHQVIQYWRDDCFRNFGEQVSTARRAGDADPNQQVIANTMKLLGNTQASE